MAPTDARAMEEPPVQLVRPPSTRWRRLFKGVVPVGIVIVVAASSIDTLRQTISLLAMGQFANWGVEFAYGFGVDVFVGTAILLAVITTLHFATERGPRQYVAVLAAVAVATAGAVLIELMMEGWLGDGETYQIMFTLEFLPEWTRLALPGILIAGTWLYVLAEAAHAEALKSVALDAARMDQQTMEARLQMLEAQIEPHFLFNTLAHVKWLYESDRTTGARMMRNLKEYLAVALPQLRERESTLAREIAHVTAYLNIQQIRMGRRLSFSINVPDPLARAQVPPLMLLTLAENAVKHGLGPLAEGGRIDVLASAQGDLLRVTIADTGAGITTSKGAGTGLANIRARLRAQFGTAARLTLAANAPRGVIATVELPLTSNLSSSVRS